MKTVHAGHEARVGIAFGGGLRSAAGLVAVGMFVAVLAPACGGDSGDGVNDASGFGSSSGGGAGGASSGGFGGGANGDGGSASGGADGAACATDADCNDSDACTKDVCDVSSSGEFTTGVCGHAPVASNQCTNSTSTNMPPAVDTTCQPGCNKATKTYPAASPLVDQVSSCTKGFEINNLRNAVYTVDTIAAGGLTAATDIEVQFATYLAPDHIKLDGVLANGTTYPVVDTCTVQTWDKADPTGGCARPPDETIRQYKVTLKPGTKQLKVDVTGVCSPIYLRVRGLCAFNIQPFVQTCAFRSVP